ncbi:pyruvate, phosphate dikinase [Stackebrandtia nassauensis]|uniref:Pyruvate, phosphate dikinase n=1 Tax=Stackebrandtia nassauensis (strain DSM 44728 / CIP 108903 / NRRL B-16338 / NBRC 102104 / LLR-40K-21) TaxID=446470 RepID=D3PYC6_STANL|nr:pyruvate, phosphate dikinase [Stackebrandtia nassauensis]ADD41493.1 pyruvate, phosphate dikinase [Stackebrandtia nassauensis DSM 44728]
MTTYVYDFTFGDKDKKDLLGGKGANLAEMTRLGLPVPPGFTITTEACREFLATGSTPKTLSAQVAEHLEALEQAMGRRLGDANDPLLVSVRSGAKFSMPGMMDTVLNVGLTDETVTGLASQAGDERFAWDSYRRLIQMFGKTVWGMDGDAFEDAIESARESAKAATDVDLGVDDLRQLVDVFKGLVREHTGSDFPQDPREQLWQTIEAVFKSWNSERAVLYRRTERIPDDLGTAVNVVGMVFGNLGPDSGTGVAFTRDPATGERGAYGDYLANAQGEDVVAGIRNTVPLSELADIDRASYDELLRTMDTLENHYRDLCDIEFTIERGKLWMLQTRVGKRTAAASFIIAAALANEGTIDLDEALGRVSGEQLSRLMFPAFDLDESTEPIAKGIPAAPGAASGVAVFDARRAVQRADKGETVILVRKETNPDDLPGMIAANGILTARGGKTSHAAVVARGMGTTCVCGADSLTVAEDSFRTADGLTVSEGDVISVDGESGAVYSGELPVKPSSVVSYFETGEVPEADRLVAAVDTIMRHADAARRLGVRANADTGEDAARARRFGATGIGLCRTEHMFLGERRELVERLVLAETEGERKVVLAELLAMQRGDFVEILSAMDGLPVTIRLLDPPLHEFLTDLVELEVRNATEDVDQNLLAAVRRMHEQNPMLGLRGVRLGLTIPGLYDMQVRAIAEAAAQLKSDGKDPRPEIMVPLVGEAKELALVRESALKILEESGVEALVGTMIEVPRAAMTAAAIAEHAEFFSFGTNDLTQMGWGFSRDDVEGSFFSRYLELGIFPVSPFQVLDTDGIGRLVEIAVADGRGARPGIHLGVCGEHGGDPDSVKFFHHTGLDYVSCSPFRVPVARLAAGQAATEYSGQSDSR